MEASQSALAAGSTASSGSFATGPAAGAREPLRVLALIRAWGTLTMLSFRQLLWSTNTLMVLFPLIGCTLFLLRRRYDQIAYLPRAINAFSHEFVILIFAAFIVPICALAYATTSIGGDRENRTLLFLLVRPIPRSLVFLAKMTATLPLVLGMVLGSFYLYCRLAGAAGELAFELYLPAIFFMTIAYISLFHLFAVTFRHSTIAALTYALFMEFFLGNMPGIIKRLAVNFYGRSIMFNLGLEEGVDLPDPQWFEPVSVTTGANALIWIAVGSLALALAIFQRREYHDLT
ncbi:MAG: ABC transporter permease subunit [Pirellulales bacterium]|nr:ABC transporter permease subunit [Pirellulales bacterium]